MIWDNWSMNFYSKSRRSGRLENEVSDSGNSKAFNSVFRSSLPYRQLRNNANYENLFTESSLPYRQLRNHQWAAKLYFRCSLPYRQLRNNNQNTFFSAYCSLPYRQLRNYINNAKTHPEGSLPYRQLRKENRGQFSHCYIRKKGDRKMQRKYLWPIKSMAYCRAGYATEWE